MERLRLTRLFDRAAPVYDTVEPRFFREIARRLVARISDRDRHRALDVATGPGVVLAELARTRPAPARSRATSSTSRSPTWRSGGSRP